MAEGSTAPNKHSVVVKPKALAAMVLHAGRHKTTSVHGLLLGSYQKEEHLVTVTDAVAVSHNAPTRPLVETAIGLLEASSPLEKDKTVIVGWYTAPELLEATKPGPVALRMAANLASDTLEPTLIVMQNGVVPTLLNGGGKFGNAIKAHGRDFGQQWLEVLKLEVEDEETAANLVTNAHSREVELFDLVDHLEGPASTPWYPNKAFDKLASA